MEPRPQRPRPKTPPGSPPNGGQQAPQVGPDPSQHAPQLGQSGQDPAAFVAPPRNEYDYSPLDLQPPGQRRKRQIIAGAIGALVVVAIGALIVAGWMALRDDDNGDTPGDTDRVAELNSPTTDDGETNEEGEGDDVATPPAEETVAEPPVVVPPTQVPEVTIYDANTIRTELPVVESMPGAFNEAGDLPQDLQGVTDALGGGADVEEMLARNGWQAAMARTFTSADPAATGSTSIVVSVHAFQDDGSAQTALPEYAAILEGYGWSPIEAEAFGDGSRTLVWTDATTGEDAVTIYVVDGQLLYRVFVIGPSGFDSTPNAIHVVNQLVGP
jgi:hypothetical protein